MPGSGGANPHTIRFGVFEVDTRTGELRKRGVKLRLTDQAYRLLAVLLEHPGEVITREQLKERVWPDGTFVDFESAINKSVSQLRAVLGDSGQNPRFIETLSKRGYRFIAPILDIGAPTQQRDAITSIAVLPLENLTGDPAQKFVADGVTEALITRLGEVSGLRVISRTSAMASLAGSKSLLSISRELHVDAVIEGSVMRSETLVRITVRLVEIRGERLIWQGKYDREISDLLEIYDHVAEAITSEINASSIRPNLESLHARAIIAPEAHIAYLKGRYLWNRRTEKDLYRSIQEFEHALAVDSGFALAHAGLADAYVLLGIWGLQPSHTAFRMARRAAERALELDDTLAEAHTCLAEVLKDYDWDWPGAEREYQRAVALNPNYSFAHYFYAQLLVSLRRYEEAAVQIELARRTDPLSPAINSYLPYVYFAARDYGRALEEGRRAVELEPYSPVAHWQLGRICLFSGAVSQAVSELEHASQLAGRSSMWEAELSFARARAGDRTGAVAVLTELTDRARSSYLSPYDIALCFAGIGDRNAALDYLEHAYQERVMRVIAIGDPEFDDLHSEPRFASLLERLRLPGAFS